MYMHITYIHGYCIHAYSLHTEVDISYIYVHVHNACINASVLTSLRFVYPDGKHDHLSYQLYAAPAGDLT